MKLIRRILACILLALVSTGQVVSAQSLAELTGTTERVSVDSDGTEGNFGSGFSSLSADGRFVAFQSRADNLVSGDINNNTDIFVHDRQTGITELVSVSSSGEQGNDSCQGSSISADGRFVGFYSFATNLVEGDTNNDWDVFVHDRQNGTTERVSVATNGTQGSGGSSGPSISADGRFVAFISSASNLVRGDTNGVEDVFLRDRLRGTTKRISVASNGTQGRNRSYGPSISADGRYVAFGSLSNNLVSGDTNRSFDTFVYDRKTGITERVSIASDGTQGNVESHRMMSQAISADGRFVAFQSDATNFVSGDTNNTRDIYVHDRLSGTTELVSVASDGTRANDWSNYPSLSADGRFVAFYSPATNLISGDPNRVYRVYVHDCQLGTTEPASVSSSGEFGSGYYPMISGDGRYVTFYSQDTNLVEDDTNNTWDVFVRDLFGGPSE